MIPGLIVDPSASRVDISEAISLLSSQARAALSEVTSRMMEVEDKHEDTIDLAFAAENMLGALDALWGRRLELERAELLDTGEQPS